MKSNTTRDFMLINESGPRHHPFSQLSRQLDMTTLARTSGHNDLRFLQERYYGAMPEQIAAPP